MAAAGVEEGSLLDGLGAGLGPLGPGRVIDHLVVQLQASQASHQAAADALQCRQKLSKFI